ncbi:hypothetical protein ACRE1S_06100 [Helicobacter himalayensis]|uniref:hypothetical protein n=1 Tax=Helicobacter himalayensis TaxID=1591088 RepID=UPI003D701063
MKDNTFNQNSHNAQLGVYASLNLTSLWEVGLKAYGQFSPTTQESYAGNFVSIADFNRAYFRLNANIGRVFKFGVGIKQILAGKVDSKTKPTQVGILG